ncbi:MAG: 4-hydroxy-tetrahydrodipicolinate synthase [Clostridia bacterium]|nr:4-hydroxy-tetrahydrodipicolinate synthase [Clostridia bacterium]
MQNPLFYGSGTALVTPFHGNRIDFDALENLIDWQIDMGTDALIVLGTTGEPSTLSPAERASVIECAAARCGHRVPLIIGTGSNSTKTAVQQSVEARMLGADALLVVTPYYNKASRTGLIEHYTAIADNSDIPVIMYNVPSRSGVNLDPETVAELARHPMLCAVKEASASLRQLTDLASACGDGIAVYCGNDDQILPAMALGARGVISVAANIIPREMHDMTMNWIKGDVKACRDLQLKYLPLIRSLFEEVNPIPVKAALSMMGKIQNTLRLPLTPLEESKSEMLRRELRRFELIP